MDGYVSSPSSLHPPNTNVSKEITEVDKAGQVQRRWRHKHNGVPIEVRHASILHLSIRSLNQA